VEGFLLDFNLPTEDLLNISVDVTGIPDFKQRYLSVRNDFMDLLHNIDKAYAKRENLHGRGVKARYSRLITGKRTVRPTQWRFSPYPSRFGNVLTTIRRKWYISLSQNTVVISKTATRNVYLLPFDKAPSLMRDKQELNNEIDDLQMNIRAFERTSDYQRVLKFVREKIGIKFEPAVANIHQVKLSLHPLRLQPKLFEDFLAEKFKNMREEGVKEIKDELERTRRELVERSVDDLQTRLGELMKYLTQVTSLKLTAKEAERLKGKIKNVQSLAESVGVGWCIQRITETDMKLVEAVAKRNKKAIQEASEAVAKEIGLKPSEKPEDTLKRATIALTEKASPRLKALMEEML